ncbi:MAG: selenide, water dikinase SelD [Candidatus Aminicenantes bacterium]|nr:selenide, water dikinase SelD [Candidatus Aminicenantes bacterium]
MIDYAKRKRVMGRSIKLGHCICNPKDPCPCDLFKQKNICLCAGEREEDAPVDVALTTLVENAGCASKIGQEDLKRALAGLPRVFNPRVLVSSDTCDDAGVYKLSPTIALVQSVDIFTPVVDDPYAFGEIAAANSVSDIYAMGGKPLTALSIVAFPIEKLSPRIMNRMLQGGIDKLSEAGVAVLGGHSIKDREIKFGFAVTGVVHPKKMTVNSKAKPGDVLILTKPIGTGTLSFARQIGRAPADGLAEAERSMRELNRAAAEAMTAAGVTTATDITGFGLAGHLGEIAAQSGVEVEVYGESIPVFTGVMDLIRQGAISGAVERNREYASAFVKRSNAAGEDLETLLYDPQTSGGLLIAVRKSKAAELLAALHKKGVESAAVIGRVTRKGRAKIVLRRKAPLSQ